MVPYVRPEPNDEAQNVPAEVNGDEQPGRNKVADGYNAIVLVDEEAFIDNVLRQGALAPLREDEPADALEALLEHYDADVAVPQDDELPRAALLRQFYDDDENIRALQPFDQFDAFHRRVNESKILIEIFY